MPRRARIAIANLPHHIVQRGHSRDAVFFDESDRADYLGTLGECRALFGIRVYAYCLMSNHVHLIVDPADRPETLSLTMHRLAGRHTRRLNERHGWTGSVWESRFFSSPVDSDRYLLACGRYVDQNPIRAMVVKTCEESSWSSYRSRAGLAESSILDLDPAIASLSLSEHGRISAYRELAAIAVSDSDLTLIRDAARRNRPTGDDSFVALLRSKNALDLPERPQGRPRKTSAR
jgi:putative transposase